MQNWDPPNSVLRESIILGYNVFDHLAARDLKTGKVGAEPGHLVADGGRHHVGGQAPPRGQVPRRLPLHLARRESDLRPRPQSREQAHRPRQPRQDQERGGRGRLYRSIQDGRSLPLFVERLTALVMQSEKVIKEKGHEWMQENPVGTGPYKLVKWNKKQDHLLVRNDDYWGPKPAFKYVRVRIIPEQATQIAELISGGVDIIKAVPPDQMDVIDKSGGGAHLDLPILRTAMLQLDQAGRTGKNPFQDRRVRQAANLAVDMDAIIKHVLNGLGDRTATTVNPMAFGFDPSVKPYRQDLAAAKKLLADAGYPNGVEVGFLQTGPVVEPALPQTSEAITADLDQGGDSHPQALRRARSGPSSIWSATARPSRCSSGRGATTRCSTPTPSCTTS